MKIGIISDTHNSETNIDAIINYLLAQQIKTVLHCGDLTAPFMIQYFAGFCLHLAFGNGDGDQEGIRQSIAIIGEGSSCGPHLDLNLAGQRIFLTHGHDSKTFHQALGSGEYQYLFHGHTHRFTDEMHGSTRVINPGAVGGRLVDQRSFVILDLPGGDLDRILLHSFG